MRVIVAIFIALIISGCSQLEGLAITPEDNAFACVRGSTNAVGGIFGAVATRCIMLPCLGLFHCTSG